MKTRQRTPFVVVAASAMVGFGIISLYVKRKRYIQAEHELEKAQQTWEAEGGTVAVPREEEEAATVETGPRIRCAPH